MVCDDAEMDELVTLEINIIAHVFISYDVYFTWWKTPKLNRDRVFPKLNRYRVFKIIYI